MVRSMGRPSFGLRRISTTSLVRAVSSVPRVRERLDDGHVCAQGEFARLPDLAAHVDAAGVRGHGDRGARIGDHAQGRQRLVDAVGELGGGMARGREDAGQRHGEGAVGRDLRVLVQFAVEGQGDGDLVAGLNAVGRNRRVDPGREAVGLLIVFMHPDRAAGGQAGQCEQ